MRFLTFNLWHGLSPSSLFAFEALEPSMRRALRERQQIELIRQLAPDFCFFQEVNPAVSRSVQFERELGLNGTYQLDLVGLKVLGLGVPFNLNSGLYIGALKKWGLKRLEGLSLTRPGFNWARKFASWQLKEERFALLAETLLPQWGRVLLVNTHIHHGLEITDDFNEKLEKMIKEFDMPVSMVSELRSRLAKGDQRRQAEIAVLMSALEKLQKRYEVIVMGGDFNAAPGSQIYQTISSAGFRDTWSETASSDPGYTFDSLKNEGNHRLQTRFPLSLVLEDLTFSAKMKEALLTLARGQETRPRRIDYVWVRGSQNIKVQSAQIVGHPDRDGLAPSDHFGVQVDLS